MSVSSNSRVASLLMYELFLSLVRWGGQLALRWLAYCPRCPELQCPEVPTCPPCLGCPSCPGGQSAPAAAASIAEPGLLRLLTAIALAVVGVLICLGAGALGLLFGFSPRLQLGNVAVSKGRIPTGRRARLSSPRALGNEPSRKVGLGSLRRRESVASADDTWAGGVYGSDS